MAWIKAQNANASKNIIIKADFYEELILHA